MPGTTTIVVVDDMPEVRTLLRARLQLSQRFTVVGEGATGTDAIALARSHHPDAMLLDLAMPIMSGVDAIPRVQAISPTTKIIVYSGRAEEGLVAQALELGAVGFITKTVPIEQLTERLEAALDQTGHNPAPVVSVEAHEALRRSEERFRLLVESVRDYAIFMLDRSGCIASWNRGAERIKGYTKDEVLGKHVRLFYDDHARQIRHPEHELEIAAREGRYEEESWRVRKDGSRFWANVVITAIRDPAGMLLGFAKVTRDITERRVLQTEREQMTAELATANGQLAKANVQLAEANQQLVAAAEDKAQFLAVTAHELRSPVQVITGAADTLAAHWTDLDDIERGELLESMRTSGDRMRRLLEDLLTAARLEAGAVKVELSPTLVRPLLLDTVAQFLAAHPDARVSVDCAGDISVSADLDRMQQIVINYLTNAVRYGRSPVQIQAVAADGWVEVRVRDHGPGVPAAVAERLFEKFAGGTEGSTTGLGLFIVRQLARAHGGEAWYERHEGVSCFGVRLPRQG